MQHFSFLGSTFQAVLTCTCICVGRREPSPNLRGSRMMITMATAAWLTTKEATAQGFKSFILEGDSLLVMNPLKDERAEWSMNCNIFGSFCTSDLLPLVSEVNREFCNMLDS